MEFSRMGVAPERPYVSAVIADGRFVFVSGQTPTRDGKMLDGSIGDQTSAVLQNIAAILDSAGAGLQDVVRCGVFLADLSQLAEFNAAYTAAFGARLPARTTVGASLPGYGVEIDCIALLPRG
ncbi:RidA family protein [Lacisediminihabitans changchengi]|uniref:RidA family protein n=1 Tax=Lacisediminihabitans changchengi TaxID=2787634 RepID=A0A934SNR2_9MICO|nr:RidA family protein [Lacisediminihabitans changchengi]MBK4348790.1 RidA family protein [Lacisediminihabitans changchengi]